MPLLVRQFVSLHDANLLVLYEEDQQNDRFQTEPKPITIYHLLEALFPLDPAKLLLCVGNVFRHFESGAAIVISIRDLFEGHAENDYAATQAYLDAAGLVQQVHGATCDVLVHPGQARARQATYGGVLPESLNRHEIHAAFTIMHQMQAAGSELLESGLTFSPTHIVMSAMLDPGNKWMVVTATDSYKNRLLLFAETPILCKEEDRFLYFGDPNRLPSSEAVPHWCLHCDLREAGAAASRTILHIHCDPINALAQNGDVDLGEGFLIPTLPHVGYGTEQSGHLLAKTMLERGILAASIQNHGQWFVADTLALAIEAAKEAHRRAIARLGQERAQLPIKDAGSR